MATAIEVRNLLGEMGEADVPTLAQRLGASKALLEALLERLLAMGVVEKVAAEPAACGSCAGSPYPTGTPKSSPPLGSSAPCSTSPTLAWPGA